MITFAFWIHLAQRRQTRQNYVRDSSVPVRKWATTQLGSGFSGDEEPQDKYTRLKWVSNTATLNKSMVVEPTLPLFCHVLNWCTAIYRRLFLTRTYSRRQRAGRAEPSSSPVVSTCTLLHLRTGSAGTRRRSSTRWKHGRCEYGTPVVCESHRKCPNQLVTRNSWGEAYLPC